jgi:hypothetical protein
VIGDTSKVAAQTFRRVFQEEKVPAVEKILSLFEPNTAINYRQKAGKPVESEQSLAR